LALAPTPVDIWSMVIPAPHVSPDRAPRETRPEAQPTPFVLAALSMYAAVSAAHGSAVPSPAPQPRARGSAARPGDVRALGSSCDVGGDWSTSR
jgi:hypothetical protein